MKDKQLFRVKPSKKPAIPELPKVWVRKPANLLHLLYGFKSFSYCLEACHPEGTGELFREHFSILRDHTDNDELICPEDEELQTLTQDGALDYFLAVEQERTGRSKIVKVPKSGRRFFKFIQFEDDELDVDCTLQTLPLTRILVSSCQSFYDYDSEEFIFLNEDCYHAFRQRQILTPELFTLIQDAKAEIRAMDVFEAEQEARLKSIESTKQLRDTLGSLKTAPKKESQIIVDLILRKNSLQKEERKKTDPRFIKRMNRFGNLVFHIKNCLKMRLIGWTLSDKDRATLEYLNKHEKALAIRVNHALQDYAGKSAFASRLQSETDFLNMPLSIDLLLKNRLYEEVNYLVFIASRSLQEHVDSINWLFRQIMCPDFQKQNIAQDYIKALAQNLTQHQLKDFIEIFKQNYPALFYSIRALASYHDKERASSSTSSPVLSITTIATNKKTYPCFPDFSRDYRILAKYADEAYQLQIRLLDMGDPLAKRKRDMPLLINDEYIGSKIRIVSLCAVVIVYIGLALATHSKLSPVKTQVETGLRNLFTSIIIGFLIALSDALFCCVYHDKNKDLGELLYRYAHLNQLNDAINDSGSRLELKHHHGIATLLLFLEPQNRQECLTYFEENANMDNPHPATRMLMYVLVVLAPACHLSSLKLTHEKIFDLICAIADHFKLKSIHDVWTHTTFFKKEQTTHDHTQAFKAILDHIQHERPFNDKLKKYLNVLSIALAKDINNLCSEYESALPTLAQFIKVKTLKAIENNDPVTLFWLTTDPFKLIHQTELVRQGIVADLNTLAEKKFTESCDQSPNMSYSSNI